MSNLVSMSGQTNNSVEQLIDFDSNPSFLENNCLRGNSKLNSLTICSPAFMWVPRLLSTYNKVLYNSRILTSPENIFFFVFSVIPSFIIQFHSYLLASPAFHFQLRLKSIAENNLTIVFLTIDNLSCHCQCKHQETLEVESIMAEVRRYTLWWFIDGASDGACDDQETCFTLQIQHKYFMCLSGIRTRTEDAGGFANSGEKTFDSAVLWQEHHHII
jgi:hypothetical protein